MRLALSAVLLATSAFGFLGVLVACSSSDDKSSPPSTDAGSDSATSTPQPTSEGGVIGDGGGGGKCEPQPLEKFPVTYAPPGPKYPAKCTPAQIGAFVDGCLGQGGTQAACDKAETDAPGCFNCMLGTVQTSPAPAVLIFPDHGALLDRHLAACVGLLTGDNSDTSCAIQVAAAIQCKLAACPGSACSDTQAFSVCQRAAAESDKSCKATEDGANACIGALPAKVRDFCFESVATSGTAVVRHYGEVFCGSAPDGGPDAGP